MKNVLLILLLLTDTLPAASGISAGEPYIFGVFPFLPSSRLEAVFAPIAKEFSNVSGRRVLYRSAPSFREFMARLKEQRYDIAFVQPFDYVRIAYGAGYIPVAKRREKLLSVFVVKENSPYKTIIDLKGKKIAMAPAVAALSYLGKSTLLDEGLIEGRDYKVVHMRGHHSCLQQVAVGDAAACVTGIPAMNLFMSKMNIKLRLIGRSPPVPQILFVVHKRVSESDRKKIKKFLLTTDLEFIEPDFRRILKKDKSLPFIPAIDSEYNSVRNMWKKLYR